MSETPKLIIPDGFQCLGYCSVKAGYLYLSYYGELRLADTDWTSSPDRLCFRKVEPEDTELLEARKKFPVGSWFYYNGGDNLLLKVRKVDRDCGRVVVWSNANWYWTEHCTPFPLPTWRCCESDKPKSLGKYYLRRKNGTDKIVTSIAPSGTWAIGYESASDYEWLDEGEL